MIDIQTAECGIYGKDREDGGIDIIVTILGPHAASMIAKFNKAHRKRTGVNGLGKLPEALAKKLKKKGKVSQKLAEKLYSQIDGFYNLMFSAFANMKIIENVDRKVIYTDNHEVEQLDELWQVRCAIWLEPEVEMITKSLVLEFNIEETTVESNVEKRIQSFAKLNPYLHLKPSASEVDDMVELSVIASADDERVEVACEEAINIRVMKDAVYPTQLFDKLAAGVSVDDKFTIEIDDPNDFPPNFAQDLLGKKVLKLEIHILRIYTCEEQKIDDDLAITAGYNNLKEWKNALTDSAIRVIDQQEIQRKRIIIVDHLLEITKSDDLPDSWAKIKAQEMKLPETDSSYSQLKNLFKHVIVLKYIGKMLDTKWDDVHKNIYERDEQAYADKVLNYLVDMADFRYVNSETMENDRRDREKCITKQSSSDRERVDSPHQA